MIDIHMHTIYSDGDKTVEELLKLCEARKLEYISITDHDTCKQYEDEAFKNNKIFTGKIIKGSELHASFQNKSIEILAYNIDTDIINKWCEKYYSEEELRKQQKIFKERLFKICDEHGLVYDKSKIPEPKKATEFVEQPIYKEVIDIIHKAGGKAFLAHPFEYKFKDTIKYIDDLREEAELDGIECFHPSSMDDDKKDILVEYARKNNLYISGGSDYHGNPKPDIEVGIGRGNLNIPKEIIEEWL